MCLNRPRRVARWKAVRARGALTNGTQRAILRTRRHKDPNPRHGSVAKRAVSRCVEGSALSQELRTTRASEGLENPHWTSVCQVATLDRKSTRLNSSHVK